MFIVGLTGGIGSGKSTIARLFTQLGVTCIDADQIARDVVKPETPALQAIVEHFGSSMLLPDGSLNRALLRSAIFDAPEQRAWLNALLHPLIRQHMLSECLQARGEYCLLMVPLLFENGLENIVHQVLAIDISEPEQIRRTTTRDQVSNQQVQKIIASQYPRQQRLQQAHDIISNADEVTESVQQQIVLRLHRCYQKAARKLAKAQRKQRKNK